MPHIIRRTGLVTAIAGVLFAIAAVPAHAVLTTEPSSFRHSAAPPAGASESDLVGHDVWNFFRKQEDCRTAGVQRLCFYDGKQFEGDFVSYGCDEIELVGTDRESFYETLAQQFISEQAAIRIDFRHRASSAINRCPGAFGVYGVPGADLTSDDEDARRSFILFSGQWAPDLGSMGVDNLNQYIEDIDGPGSRFYADPDYRAEYFHDIHYVPER